MSTIDEDKQSVRELVAAGGHVLGEWHHTADKSVLFVASCRRCGGIAHIFAFNWPKIAPELEVACSPAADR